MLSCTQLVGELKTKRAIYLVVVDEDGDDGPVSHVLANRGVDALDDVGEPGVHVERRILADAAFEHGGGRFRVHGFRRGLRQLERATPADESGQQHAIGQQQQRERGRAAGGERFPMIANAFRHVVLDFARTDIGLCLCERARLLRCTSLGLGSRELGGILRLLHRRERARLVVANLADLAVAVEDAEEHRDEHEAPRAAQIEAVDPEKAGEQPEQVGDEELRPAIGRVAPLPRHKIYRDEREQDQTGPVEPMRQDEIEAGHGGARDSSDMVEAPRGRLHVQQLAIRAIVPDRIVRQASTLSPLYMSGVT